MRFMLLSLALLLATVIGTQSAQADGCRVVGNRPFVATPLGHHAPIVSYAHAYTPTLAVPVEVRTFFSVDDRVAQAKINQAIADEAAEKATNKLLGKLLDEQRKQQATPRSTTEEPKPSDSKSSEITDPLANLPISYGSGESQDNNANHGSSKAIFAAHCVSCHGSGSKLDLTAPERLTKEDWARIDASVSHEENYKSMPPKKPKLSFEDRQTIRKEAYGLWRQR